MPSMVRSSVGLGLEHASNTGARKILHVADRSLRCRDQDLNKGIEQTVKSVVVKAAEKIITTWMILIHTSVVQGVTRYKYMQGRHMAQAKSEHTKDGNIRGERDSIKREACQQRSRSPMFQK